MATKKNTTTDSWLLPSGQTVKPGDLIITSVPEGYSSKKSKLVYAKVQRLNTHDSKGEQHFVDVFLGLIEHEYTVVTDRGEPVLPEDIRMTTYKGYRVYRRYPTITVSYKIIDAQGNMGSLRTSPKLHNIYVLPAGAQVPTKREEEASLKQGDPLPTYHELHH